jgi:hypothetical protein
MSVDMETIKIMINVATFSMSQKIKTLETTLQSKLDEQESKYKKEIDRLETQNENLYKMIEKLNENNTQKEMMCEDKNCCELENNYNIKLNDIVKNLTLLENKHEQIIKSFKNTELFVSNLNNNIVIKNELDELIKLKTLVINQSVCDLINKVAELEKSMKTSQHTNMFVSTLYDKIVLYKTELDELTKKFQLQVINNESSINKVTTFTKVTTTEIKVGGGRLYNCNYDDLLIFN